VVTLEPCSPVQARDIGARLRQADYDELLTLHNRARDIVPDFLYAVVANHPSLAVMVRGEPVAVGGCIPLTDQHAAVWLLCTDGLAEADVGVRATRVMRRQVDEWARRWSLINVLDGHNALHLKFVRALGFEFGDRDGRALLFKREAAHV